jgi:iron(III) transport system permease protein
MREAFGRGESVLVAVALLMAALVCLPILSVLASLLQPTSDAWVHVVERLVPRYLLNTLWLALGVGAATLVMGVGCAWLVVSFRFPGASLFEWALILPLAIPAYVMAYAYYDLMASSGPIQTAIRTATGLGFRDYWFPRITNVGGAAFVLALGLYPYVYLAARTAFLRQASSLVEVSRMLGCNRSEAFRRVMLPLARPAIAVGVLLVLMETLADFGAVSLLGVQTFTTGIYRAWFSLGDPVAAAQIGCMLLGFVLMLVLLERGFRRGRAFNPSAEHRFDSRETLSGWRSGLAVAFCLMPLGLGFLVPVARLFWLTIDVPSFIGIGRFSELIANSVTVAGVASLLAVAIGLLIAFATRLAPRRIVLIAAALAAMGYALPGPVIALGTLIPLATLDNAVDAWSRATFGVSTGLILTGSVAALVFAYLVRFMAVSLGTIDAGFAKIKPSLDDAASVLGSSVWQRLRRVHIPLLWPSLGTALILVFVDVMKELPATLVLRPLDFDTLAVRVYNLVRDERIAEAGLPALVLVAVGLVPVYLLSRRLRGDRAVPKRTSPATSQSPAIKGTK